ncbi:MAG: tetratricopeptide repeat protein [Phycisphaerales bacterium]
MKFPDLITHIAAVVLTATLSLSAAGQGGNPLDPANQPPPLPPQQQQQAPGLPVFYEGGGLIMTIERMDQQQGTIAGTLLLGDNVFTYQARFTAEASIEGSFTAGQQQYPFTAIEDAQDAVTFRTGQSSYTMQQVDRPSRPVPRVQPQQPPAFDPRGGGGGNGGGVASPNRAELERAIAFFRNNDIMNALKITEPLAERGHIGACYLTGLMLANNSKEPERAPRYLETAAQENHPGALHTLGSMTLWGHGTEKDQARGYALVKRAVELGDPAAMIDLAGFTFNGAGTQANRVDGLAWMLIASDRIDPNIDPTVGNIIKQMKADPQITQQEWQQAEQRKAALAQSLPPVGPQPDYVLDFDRIATGGVAPAPPIQPGGGGGGGLPTGNNFAGTWSGMASEQFPDGSMHQYPVRITVNQTQNGATADVAVELKTTDNAGQPMTILVNGRYTGQQAAGARLELNCPDVTMRSVETGQTMSMGASTLRLEPGPNGTVIANLGNDINGWTRVELRQQGSNMPGGGSFPNSGGTPPGGGGGYGDGPDQIID